ncbi:MAG: Hint domain-containing protein [Rhodobacteraceae bacterium]|nr:Hint domain-containing protein [Paracoccaceae bacterium]
MLELFLFGDQVATYSGVTSSGNANGVQVTLSGVETLGSSADVFRIVVRQINSGQDAFQNGQRVDIYSWPDNTPIVQNLNPQHDMYQGRASSGSHQIFTNANYAFDLAGFTGATAQYGPGSDPPRSERLPFDNLLSDPPAAPCFTAGTPVETPDGWRDVAALRPGDRVMTRDHGPQEILWVGVRRVAGIGEFAPVRFAPGVLGNRDPLLVSPQHRMMIHDWRAELWFGEGEVFVAARHLVDGCGITFAEMPSVTYVHVLLARHEVMNADGAAAESLHLGPYAVSSLPRGARAEIAALFPEIATDVRHAPRTARRCLRGWEGRMLAGRADPEAQAA